MHWLTWLVVIVATAGVIIRPWRLPEAVWAVTGAIILVAGGLLPWRHALQAVGRGTDVYLFLTGMMLLSEVARREGLFDWLAAFAVRRSGGSARRLFLLIYGVGTVVTAFLSNDATAVVMTPAVFAVASKARAEPLPYLFVCAFIANAASFILPISNPANLVLYASHMPPLFTWLGHFLLPSVLSVAATLGALLLIERRHLAGTVDAEIEQPALPPGGLVAAIGIGLTAVLLLAASTADVQLGLPTAVAGVATALVVLWRNREAPWATLRGISWLVLPLVGGLFVLVEGLRDTGSIAALAHWLHAQAEHSVQATAWGAGIVLALVCNVMNNLPAGLVASSTVTAGHLPQPVTDALLIGVDLGPNLSITGSLATILWLTAIRREGEDVTFLTFLARGAMVMPPALLLALAGLLR
ncbi:MAG: arsenic transporter [Proteobacteria bacterium]|nr:arsenic transporter [Pseudomonadota bacterium]